MSKRKPIVEMDAARIAAIAIVREYGKYFDEFETERQTREQTIPDIAKHISAAINAEREACAMLALPLNNIDVCALSPYAIDLLTEYLENIVRKIRARGE